MNDAPLIRLHEAPAAKVFGSPRRRAGWWPATLLGALLVLPAELAVADSPRGERTQSSKASSASKSSGSSARSAGSRTSSRSQPRASSRTSSRGQPRASSRTKPSRRSGADARSRKTRRSREAYEPATRRRADVPTRRSPESRTLEGRKPADRTEEAAGSRRFTRPRYRTPAERAAETRPRGAVERRGPADAGERDRDRDRDRHYQVEVAPPDNPGAAIAGRGRGGEYRDRRHRGPRYGGYGYGYGGYRHRHSYGCGHYGYGRFRYGYDPFDPYYYGFGFNYYSPFFYWGLGGYAGPTVHVYGGGGGASRVRREIGQGALDLDLRPGSTEIYVDGAYVGVADQFDGFPTYLWLEEGTYEIAFYKEGYETIFRQYRIYPGVTIDVRDRMRPGQAVSPTAPAVGDPAGEPPATSDSDEAPAGVSSGDGGRIAIAASPGDAAVYLDGHFVGTAAEVSSLDTGLIVEPGEHVIEIIRPGYDNQRVPVSVAKGERIDLQLDLRRP